MSNLILLFVSPDNFYKFFFIGQLVFYGMAVLASVIALKTGIFKIFKLAYYFVFMNLSVIQGFFRFLRGKQPAAWEKAKRNRPVIDAE